ncbi:MAG: hypothetical protein IJI45_01070 [Anaerolineaceae bacterium]|nr:hypothetical protein [Anaerolineaceae bacterium]
MGRIKKKLKSERGASITWALLIFLVCAVIGSAVLVAGTAASGRMSKVAENDQRYYAVNSAARLLIKKIDGITVTFSEKSGKVYDGSTSVEETTVFNSIPKEAAYYLICHPAAPRNSYEITVDTNKEGLDVSAVEALAADGSMTLTISGRGNSTDPNPYTLKLSFSFDKNVMNNTDKGTIHQYAWHLRDIEVVGSKRWTA